MVNLAEAPAIAGASSVFGGLGSAMRNPKALASVAFATTDFGKNTQLVALYQKYPPFSCKVACAMHAAYLNWFA